MDRGILFSEVALNNVKQINYVTYSYLFSLNPQKFFFPWLFTFAGLID